MTRVLVIGGGSLCLALLAGCMSAPPLPEPVVTVTGCPVVTRCSLLPAAPQSNADLSDDTAGAQTDNLTSLDDVAGDLASPRRNQA